MRHRIDNTDIRLVTGNAVTVVYDLRAESFSKEKAARILDVSVKTLERIARRHAVGIKPCDGYHMPRVLRDDLLFLLRIRGDLPGAGGFDDVELPARAQRLIDRLKAEVEVS